MRWSITIATGAERTLSTGGGRVDAPSWGPSGALVHHAGTATTSRLLRGLLIWLTVSLGLWLILLAADNLLHLPAGLRLAVSLGGLALMGFELWQLLLRPLNKEPETCQSVF